MHHRWIVALLLLFVLLAAAYHVAVPLGEGPDEPGHMAYVLFLAQEQRLPTASEVPGEGHQPPLAYLLMLPAALWLPPESQQITLTANPHFLWNDGHDPAAFVRSSNEYWPWQGVTLAWHLARAVSLLLGMVTIYCTWRAARVLCTPAARCNQVALLAAALVAFNPQFLFTSALVTNDTLLTALSAGLFWLCVSTRYTAAPSQRTVPLALVAGTLAGLALLTKQSALLLLPLLAWWGWRLSGGRWHVALLHTAAWTAAAGLVAGWWYLRNWHLYGDPLGLSAFRATYATQPFIWSDPAAWGAALLQLGSSFWARFGWLSLHPPTPVLWFYAVLMLLALVGWLWPRPAAHVTLRSIDLVLLLVLLAFAWVVSFALLAGLVAWQGRMLFPALPAIAMLLAGGLLRCVPHTPLVIIGGIVGLALVLPAGVIAPAYEWHTLPPALAQQRIDRPAYARYAQEWEQGVELRGWRLSRAGGERIAPGVPVQAGEPLSVTLTWHALERVPDDWTVFLHLVDAQGKIVAEHNSRPQHGTMPLPLWTPGDWLEDTHPLVLPADLPPGEYTLRVGLYLPWQRDPRQGHRQEVWARDSSRLGDLAEVGWISIEHDFAACSSIAAMRRCRLCPHGCCNAQSCGSRSRSLDQHTSCL